MLDTVIPNVASAPASRLIRTELEFLCLPGIESKISFLPLVKYLKEKQLATSGMRSEFYQTLIDKFEAEPDLLKPIEDISLINTHADLLELLANAIFPMVGDHEKNIFTFSTPYQFQIFYYSELFRKLFIHKDKEFLKLPEGISEQRLMEVQCSAIYEQILQKFYGIKLNESAELVYPVVDVDSGMKHYYRMRYDKRFIDIQLKGKLPDIHDCAVCLNTFRILNLDQQLEKMPLELFMVEGFAIWIAEDVTTMESLESMKRTLLRQDECDTETVNELKQAIHTLVGLNDVEIGIMPFVKVNDQFVLEDDCSKYSLIGRSWKSSNKEDTDTFKTLIHFLHEMPGPAPVSNLTPDVLQRLPFMKGAVDAGFQSYISYPMQNSDGLLGVLELGSPIPFSLSQDTLSRIEPAMPLLSLAMLKNRDTFAHKIEREIKEKFTALQPSVEWKFADVAWKFMKKNRDMLADNAGNVEFEDVYPLYGAIDIRNSSQERNIAIQKDLKEYLNLIDYTLGKMESLGELPLLEDLKFKNMNFSRAIDEVLLAEDEVRIAEFLENELEPVFSHLQKTNSKDKELLSSYFEVIRNCDGYLYHYRKEYEQTMTTINHEVLTYLEKEEDQMQKSFPHYFEKYRTDGVEYNIYIGQSISPSTPFDLLYLRNIRLWQLKSMAEIARLTHKLLPSLKVPLQTTQLILINSQPISISFRKDERRFDVEGSRNIRYEVMKKRLDKVRLKDTNERLTQTGKIALVYSNQKEVQEYQAYIELLQNKNILKPSLEFVELEDLQGIRGLKAMRVEIELQ